MSVAVNTTALTQKEIEQLPLRFMVALAARCTLRVMPLIGKEGELTFWRDEASYYVRSIDVAALSACGFAINRRALVMGAGAPSFAAAAYWAITKSSPLAASSDIRHAIWTARAAANAANNATIAAAPAYAAETVPSVVDAVAKIVASYSSRDSEAQDAIVHAANVEDVRLLRSMYQGSSLNADEIVPLEFFDTPLWPDGQPEGWQDVLANWDRSLTSSHVDCHHIYLRHLRMLDGQRIDWSRAESDVAAWHGEYRERQLPQSGTGASGSTPAADRDAANAAIGPVELFQQRGSFSPPSGTNESLIDAALQRQLVITTFDRADVDSARELFHEDSVTWRFGPSVRAGDFVLVYFPQRIDVKPNGPDAKLKSDGFRLLFRAIEDSHAAPKKARWRQESRIADRLELEPIRFSLLRDDPVLREWGQGGQVMTRLGQQAGPLHRETARAFWKLLVDTNGERVLEYLRRHLPSGVADVRTGVADVRIGPVAAQGTAIFTPPPSEPAIPASIRDEPATVDLLRREPLVKSLAAMFASREQGTPFTVGLLGDWGAGKSSVLNLVKQELERYVRKSSKRANRKNPEATAPGGNQSATPHEAMQFCFAQFNAWEYEKTQSVSAGLAQEVVKGLISGVGWREHSWLQFRFAWSEGAWQFKALFVIAALLLIGGAATAHAWVPLLARNAWRLMGAADGAGALTKPAESSVILILVLLTTYLTAKVKTVLDHPLTVQLDTYLKLPDYGQHLGLIPILKRQIRTLCHMRIGRAREKWMIRLCRAFPSMPFRWVLRQYMRWRGRKQAQHRRLVVYVDDLDRCGTECIVQTLDAVRLVMDIPDVIVVIAIDHRIALKAVAEHYKDLADGARPREAIARDYLGKIIQLPILLSAAHKEGLELFIEEKLFPEAVDDETPTTPTGVTPTPGKTGHSTDRTEEAGAKPAGKRETGPKLPPAVVDAGPGSVSPPAQVTDEPARQRQTRPEPTVEFLQQQMQHTTTERKLFTELSRTLRITNPRQLTRLRNCYRLLKTMVAFQGRHGDGSLRLDPPRLMRLLFWHEFLGQCPQSVRDSSKQHLSTAEGQLPEPLQSVLSDVRGNKKLREAVLEAENSDIERLVKALILPHSVVESDRANAIQSKRTAKRVPGARR